MTHKGSCHCGKVTFEVDGEIGVRVHPAIDRARPSMRERPSSMRERPHSKPDRWSWRDRLLVRQASWNRAHSRCGSAPAGGRTRREFQERGRRSRTRHRSLGSRRCSRRSPRGSWNHLPAQQRTCPSDRTVRIARRHRARRSPRRRAPRWQARLKPPLHSTSSRPASHNASQPARHAARPGRWRSVASLRSPFLGGFILDQARRSTCRPRVSPAPFGSHGSR